MAALPSHLPDHQVSNSSLSPAVIVGGIDALYLSGTGTLAEGLLDELAYQRDLAEARLPATAMLGPLPFAVMSRGFGKYRFCLDHPIGRVGLSPSDHLPPVRVQPRSEFLHAVGPEQAVATFAELLTPICPELRLSVSRIDLYADVRAFPLDHSDRERFVCRADTRRSYETSGTCTGFDFGARGSRCLHARVYDKLFDVLRAGHDWWFEIWAESFDEVHGVTRVEIEFPRKVLTDFDLDTPPQVLAATSALWRYATGDWITLRLPNDDTNRARWPLDPVWELVQQAPLGSSTVELERLKARARAGSLRRLTPGLVGYLAGFAALVGTAGIPDTLEALDRHMRDDEIVRRTPFAERIEQRHREGRSS